MIAKLKLRAFIFFNLVIASVADQNLLNCDADSSSPDYYSCDKKNNYQKSCKTYAILRANTHFSSLSNLSFYLGIARSDLAEANGLLATATELFFANDQPILIPINCKCSNGGIFEAEVTRATTDGESLYGIAESFEGLTTCNTIREINPSVNLREKIDLLIIPLKCACPSPIDPREFLLSYPVKEGDTLPDLAIKFNVSQETLISANNRDSRSGFRQSSTLSPLSTLLIPLEGKPVLSFYAKPDSTYPSKSIGVRDSHKRRKKHKMLMIGVYIAIGLVTIVACLAIAAAFFFIQWKKKKHIDPSNKSVDLELQQLSLSIRTTSDKKVSFEGSQYNFDDPTPDATTPMKSKIENYTFEELQKATEDFNLSNLIEGSVFHGRLRGKNLAIKRVSSTTISKIDLHLCHGKIHRHPNTIRLLGTCLRDGADSYIAFEYAKNGSLKDWIHGGLAIKSHFISSCSCFLTWNQRLKICLDVAAGLQHMHHVMNPSYIHMHIRSRNIFLDDEFGAKIGNFGMSKCTENETNDRDIGYLAPEYLDRGAVSTSIDVFAYGVILLEILSGKPSIRSDENGEQMKITDEIKHVLRSEDAEELRGWMDGALGENYSFDSAVMLANLARVCVEDDTGSRPNAVEIVEKLLRLVEEEQQQLAEEFRRRSVCESSCKPLVKTEL